MPSLESLLLDAWNKWRPEFRRCRRSASTGPVHRVRVESRRVLAILALFDTGGYGHVRPVRKVVKATLDALSKIRDAHVQLDDAKTLVKQHQAAQPFIDHLDRRERRLRKSARGALRSIHVKPATRACKRLAHAYAADSPTAASRLARPAMAGAWEDVEGRLQDLDTRDTHTIHRVRVALKNVRYMLEAGIGLQALEPRLKVFDGAEVVETVRRMGRLHDADMLLARLDAFVAKQTSRAEAVASMHEALTRRRGQLLRRVLVDVQMLRRIHGETRRTRAASVSHAPQHRGRQEPDQGSRGLALPLDVDAAHAALLERQRPAGSQENGRELAEIRFVADQRDAIRGRTAELREKHRGRLAR